MRYLIGVSSGTRNSLFLEGTLLSFGSVDTGFELVEDALPVGLVEDASLDAGLGLPDLVHLLAEEHSALAFVLDVLLVLLEEGAVVLFGLGIQGQLGQVELELVGLLKDLLLKRPVEVFLHYQVDLGSVIDFNPGRPDLVLPWGLVEVLARGLVGGVEAELQLELELVEPLLLHLLEDGAG